MAPSLRSAAEYIATEIAWNGHATHSWIEECLAKAGHTTVKASNVIAFGLEFGFITPVPQLGGYVCAKRVNARVFGERFAAWVLG